MLELQAKGINELEGVGKPSRERKPLIRKIMEDSGGWIDAIIMVVNGTRITFTEDNDIDLNNIASAAYTIIEATLAVMEFFGSRKLNEINIRMQEGRHLIIKSYKGCHIAALTKPNPNLGLIKLALEKNLASNKPSKRRACDSEPPLYPLARNSFHAQVMGAPGFEPGISRNNNQVFS